MYDTQLVGVEEVLLQQGLPNFARIVAAGLRCAGVEAWAQPLVARTLRDYLVEVPVGVRDADDAVAALACEALRAGGGPLDAWVRHLVGHGLDTYEEHRRWFVARLGFQPAGEAVVFQAVWVARASRIVEEP